MPHIQDPSAPLRATTSVSSVRPASRGFLRRVGALAAFGALALSGGTAAAAAAADGGSEPAQSAQSAGVSESTVRSAQRKLGVDVDGVIGSATRAAIRRFQRKVHIKVTGRLDRATLRKLGLRARQASTGAGGAAAGEKPKREKAPAIPAAARATLERIAECESGGDPEIVSANGLYRGKYQFSRETWRAVGGTGDPAAAPEAEQDRRAYILFKRAGTSPWPVCGANA